MTLRRLWPAALVLAVSVVALPTAAADKKDRQPPAAGAVFHFDPDAPKYATCDVEFRDPKDELWPNFFYGAPAAPGTYTFDPAAPAADFSLRCDHLVQKNGDQSRRVLGELLAGDKAPVVVFAVRSLGKFQSEEVKDDKKGSKSVEYAPFDGVLTVGEKAMPVQGRAMFRYDYSKGAVAPDSAAVECTCTINGADLGLKNAAGQIRVWARATAYSDPKK